MTSLPRPPQRRVVLALLLALGAVALIVVLALVARESTGWSPPTPVPSGSRSGWVR